MINRSYALFNLGMPFQLAEKFGRMIPGNAEPVAWGYEESRETVSPTGRKIVQRMASVTIRVNGELKKIIGNARVTNNG